MEGSKAVQTLNGLNNFLGDKNGLGKLFAAMYQTMTNGIDFIHALYNADLGIGKGIDYQLDGIGMILKGIGKLNRLPAGGLVGHCAVNADTLAQTFGDNITALGIHELILEGRTACVDNQNLHCDFILR